MLPDVRLGQRDHLDHSLVRLASGVTPREDAVVHQHHADRLRAVLAGIQVGAQVGQLESGHHVRDAEETIAVDLLDQFGAVHRVGERDDRVRVRVVDPLERDDRMEDRFDRW